MLQPTESASQILTKHVAQIDWSAIYLSSFKEFFTLMLHLWQLWLFLGVITLMKVGFWLYHYHRLAKAGMPEIDNMTGSEFESRLAILFRNLGYTVQRTGKVGDYGVDLV